ncbi:MAG: peroxide stress protein YaaA [Nocardioidaceae bacterium]
MLVLLPPSEGKTSPRRGKPLDLAALSFPSLAPARREVLASLLALCTHDPAKAVTVLGLGPTQSPEVAHNARLLTAPSAAAERVYSGVLYAALDLPGLDAAAHRRAVRRIAVASGLFGLVRLSDRIPAYRLSGDVSLPGIGPVAAIWRQAYSGALPDAVGRGPLLDLRSGVYAGFFRPSGALAARTVTIRVLHEQGGTRKVVSHFNKATKGRLVRDLLVHDVTPTRIGGLVDALGDLGWKVEQHDRRLDVVVSAV